LLPARRHEISQLEAFSDAVFAFALTLLVVSLDAPKSYDDLIALMAGFVPFAASFALLIWIWHEHDIFSGFTYFLMGPAQWAFGVPAGRRRKTIENRLAPVVGI
jgi:uncharacterized membrane protein